MNEEGEVMSGEGEIEMTIGAIKEDKVDLDLHAGTEGEVAEEAHHRTQKIKFTWPDLAKGQAKVI
jgi:hypothetical protein